MCEIHLKDLILQNFRGTLWSELHPGNICDIEQMEESTNTDIDPIKITYTNIVTRILYVQ